MAAIVRFDQDPSVPPGTGTFYFDDGRTLYAHDPETAAKVGSQPMQPSPDIVAASQRGPDQRLASNGPSLPGGPMNFDQFKDQLGQMKFGTPTPPPGPAVGGGPPPGAPAEDPDAAYKRNLAATVRAAATSGPTRGGMTPRGQQVSVTSEGMPYDRDSPEYKERQEALEKVQAAGLAQAQTEAELPRLIHEHAEAQLPDLMKERDRARVELEDQRNRYKQERGELDSLLEQNRKRGESYNANRWFENQSVIGKIGAVLAQAFGARAATLGHTENWAQKIIDNAVQRDIDTQKQQILEGKEGANNALASLKMHFGDMQQAESALKIAQTDVISTQIKSYAASTNNKELIAKADTWAAELDQKNVANEQAFQNASYGKRTVSTSSAYQAPSGGGFSMQKALQTAAELEKLGVPKEDIQQILLGKKPGGSGGAPDDVDPKNVRKIGDQQFAFNSPEEAKQANPQRIAALESVVKSGQRVQNLLSGGGAWTPSARGELSSLQSELSLSYGPAFSGSTRINETEIKQGQRIVGDPDSWIKTDLTGNRRAGIQTIIDHAQEELDALRKTGKPVSEVTTKNAEGQRGVGYRFSTEPKTLRTYSPTSKKPETKSDTKSESEDLAGED